MPARKKTGSRARGSFGGRRWRLMRMRRTKCSVSRAMRASAVEGWSQVNQEMRLGVGERRAARRRRVDILFPFWFWKGRRRLGGRLVLVVRC